VRILAALLCSSWLCGCATPAAVRPAAFAHHAATIDWAKAGDEAVAVLSAYLQVDTQNPPGHETRAAQHLAALLEKEGLTSTLHEFAPGRANLVARLKAEGVPTAKPLCLLSHTDVVPADPKEWPRDTGPLSGAVKDGYVWGRGALDMKGMGALELLTFLWLHRQKVPLKRDVLLLAVGDEEVNNLGMSQVVDTLWHALDCGAVLNEGGIGIKALFFEGQTVFPITVAEKGTLWLKLVARGEPGHGSTPVPGRAPARLLEAVNALAALQPLVRIHPSLYELLRQVGMQKQGLTGFVLQHPPLVRAFVTRRLLANPATRAAVTDTCQVTGYRGAGSSPNVIPSQVEAVLDCRVLPGTTPAALKARLTRALRGVEGVSLEVLQERAATASDWDDPLFDALVNELRRGRPDVVAGPALSPGFTDSILARPRGAKAYGLVPFEIELEELKSYHGVNERVSVANVRRGLEVLFRAVVEASAAR
jgi:acetylornithine deacetylase/succinyl-diaminopimelate desuccinylase-like protein